MNSTHFNGSEETVELILRTVISDNQLSIYGAVADLCKELDPNSRNQTEGEICDSLVIPTEIPNANAKSQSSTSLAQGDSLQEDERKFGELPDDQKLSKLCSDAGFLQEIEKGQFFITLEEGSDFLQTACREYTQLRNLKTSRPRGWILSNTKICPVLGVCQSILTKGVIVLISSQKRQKKFSLRTFNCPYAQGDFLKRLSQDRNLL